MRQPAMFGRLLNYWITMPKVLDQGIAYGDVTRDQRPGSVLLKGLSAISDAFPPAAYANPGFSGYLQQGHIMKFRKREAFSAFWSGINKSELEARLETYAQFTAVLAGQPPPRSPFPFSSSSAAEYSASNEVDNDIWIP